MPTRHIRSRADRLAGLVEMLLIFLVCAALTNTFARMVGGQRQGWALFAAMAVLFLAGAAVVYTNAVSLAQQRLTNTFDGLG